MQYHENFWHFLFYESNPSAWAPDRQAKLVFAEKFAFAKIFKFFDKLAH